MTTCWFLINHPHAGADNRKRFDRGTSGGPRVKGQTQHMHQHRFQEGKFPQARLIPSRSDDILGFLVKFATFSHVFKSPQVDLCLEPETQHLRRWVHSFIQKLSILNVKWWIPDTAASVRPPWWAVGLQRHVRRWGRRAGRAGGWIHTEADHPPGYGTAGAHTRSPSRRERKLAFFLFSV